MSHITVGPVEATQDREEIGSVPNWITWKLEEVQVCIYSSHSISSLRGAQLRRTKLSPLHWWKHQVANYHDKRAVQTILWPYGKMIIRFGYPRRFRPTCRHVVLFRSYPQENIFSKIEDLISHFPGFLWYELLLTCTAIISLYTVSIRKRRAVQAAATQTHEASSLELQSNRRHTTRALE